MCASVALVRGIIASQACVANKRATFNLLVQGSPLALYLPAVLCSLSRERPSAAARWLNRVAIILSSTAKDIYSLLILITLSPLARGPWSQEREPTCSDGPPTHHDPPGAFALVSGSPFDSVRPPRTSGTYMVCRRARIPLAPPKSEAGCDLATGPFHRQYSSRRYADGCGSTLTSAGGSAPSSAVASASP